MPSGSSFPVGVNTVTFQAVGASATATCSFTVTVTPFTITAGATTNPTTCGGTDGSIAFTAINIPNGTYSLSYTGTGSPKNVTVASNTFSLTGLSQGSYSNFSLSNNGCTATNNVTKQCYK